MNFVFCRKFLPVGLVLAILANPLTTYQAKADSGEDLNSVTGSWLFKLSPKAPPAPQFPAFLALGTFAKEGTFVGTAQGDGTGDPSEGPAHGAWVKTGSKDFQVRFLTLNQHADRSLFGIFTVTMQLSLDASGNQISGDWQGVTVDPGGNIIFQVQGHLTAQRILVQ